jgi:integrase
VIAKLDSKTSRAALPPRREPYWEKLFPARFLGYRAGPGTWVARAWALAQDCYVFKSLGDEETLDYTQAKEAAIAWTGRVVQAIDPHYTVTQAVADYVEHLRVENSPAASHDVKLRLKKHLEPKLGKVKLSELTTQQLKRWHQGLVKTSDEDPDRTRASKNNANTLLSSVKAAFNLAFQNGVVSSDTAWRRVKAFRGTDAARKLFLTDVQVKAWIDNTTGGYQALVKAAALTGARYGELVNARVRDLDVGNGVLRLAGKTGERHAVLADDALEHLKVCAKDKLPKALLFARDDGSPWGKSHQHRPMKDARIKAKLPPETVFYSLRHYYISKALLAGVQAQVVAENCGTSLAMIEKHYGKFLRADRKAMLDKVALTAIG